MPVPGFLASIADKAQSAINASPLAGHLPNVGGHGRPVSPDASTQPSANETAAQGGHRSHAFESLQYQLRSFQQQYSSSTTPAQRIVTSAKGIAIDFDSAARDAKNYSKELYTWGQNEDEDLKDVSDRLAYLNFVQGALASSLALKIDSARIPFKALRDAEVSLAPRRNLRAGLHAQLAKLEHDQVKGGEKKILEIKDQIRKAEVDDASQEKEIELLKRKALREGETLKWEAVREVNHIVLPLMRMLIASIVRGEAGAPVAGREPHRRCSAFHPAHPSHPYTGAQATGAARASLQRALDNYKTGHINLLPQAGADLSRSDTRSFGETHASELSSISNSSVSLPGLPQQQQQAQPAPPGQPIAIHPISPPINPMSLNQSPVTIPPTSASPTTNTLRTPIASSDPLQPIAPQLPTVAETVCVTDCWAPVNSFGSDATTTIVPNTAIGGPPSGAVKFESAEEEKRRLQREDRDKLLVSGGSGVTGVPAQTGEAPPPAAGAGASAPAKYETAEEEKKRLEPVSDLSQSRSTASRRYFRTSQLYVPHKLLFGNMGLRTTLVWISGRIDDLWGAEYTGVCGITGDASWTGGDHPNIAIFWKLLLRMRWKQVRCIVFDVNFWIRTLRDSGRKTDSPMYRADLEPRILMIQYRYPREPPKASPIMVSSNVLSRNESSGGRLDDLLRLLVPTPREVKKLESDYQQADTKMKDIVRSRRDCNDPRSWNIPTWCFSLGPPIQSRASSQSAHP
ncbi:Eisosome component PIL1-domain-containing protein [Salix suchowensis]|nr:Eisosome component PIL1-domain-containing protein [Salix suchowensis]